MDRRHFIESGSAAAARAQARPKDVQGCMYGFHLQPDSRQLSKA